MKTSDIKKTMVESLEKPDSPARSVHNSMCYGDGSGLGSPTIVEAFTVQAKDGSIFLVTITKLGNS